MSAPRILPAGEAAVAVEFGDGIDPRLNARVQALDRKLLSRPFAGFQEAVPTYRSLLVFFDPFRVEPGEVAEHLLELARDLSDEAPAAAPLKEVPTVYDGEDLDKVAHDAGLSRSEVIAIHSGLEYRVYMLGFSPGFAYMGMLPAAIETPRMATPRTRVPAGSVAVAGRQTAVYPSATPGGWNLIGRSSLRLFDARSSPPTFFSPGDRVRFVSVSNVDEAPAPGAMDEPPAGDATLEVLDGGLLTTVQDLGRAGYQRCGVPVAGAADAAALRAANFLVGNPPGAAGLECTGEFEDLAVGYQFGDAWSVEQQLARGEPAATGLPQQYLSDRPAESARQHSTILEPTIDRQVPQHALECGDRTGCRKRADHQAARLGGLERDGDGFARADVADDEHVGVLTEGGPRGSRHVGAIATDLALADEGLLVVVRVPDLTIEHDDMHAARRVDQVDQCRAHGRLAALPASGHEDQTVWTHDEPLNLEREAELLHRGRGARVDMADEAGAPVVSKRDASNPPHIRHLPAPLGSGRRP